MNYLWPSLGPMKIPVVVYGILLSFMGALANSRQFHTTEKSYWNVLIGAVFFIASDSLIAVG